MLNSFKRISKTFVKLLICSAVNKVVKRQLLYLATGEAHKISFYALPWVTAALLLVAFVVLLFIYIRRSNYLRKDFASQSLIPDSGYVSRCVKTI